MSSFFLSKAAKACGVPKSMFHMFLENKMYVLYVFVIQKVCFWCAYNNNSEGVRKLLQSVSSSHVSIISSSSPQGVDIVLTDVDGKTALHWTASNDDDTTIRVLLVST